MRRQFRSKLLPGRRFLVCYPAWMSLDAAKRNKNVLDIM
jgi:hypothetical protein